MPLNEFWHGDMRLLSAYQKAYYRDVSFRSWNEGQYNSAAFGVVISNAFSQKGKKAAEYPEWKDPIEKISKPKVTKENAELEYRKQQASQQSWLAEMIRK